jgi:GNAT superfamily N-acetyltransferase
MYGPQDGPHATARESAYEQFIRMAREAEWRLLDEVAKVLYGAHERAEVTDEQFTYVFAIITGRRRGVPFQRDDQARRPTTRAPESNVGSRPRTDGSFARRRYYLAIGLLPDSFLASGARWGIYAVLTFIGRIIMERGRCELFVDEIAARTGYGSSTVQEALKFARLRGWLAVEYRRPDGQRRNLSNLVTLASAEWKAWLKTRAAGWRGLTKRGRAFWGMLGSNFAGTTRTRDKRGVGLTTDNTDHGAPSAPGRAAGGQTARPGPSRPPRVAPA